MGTASNVTFRGSIAALFSVMYVVGLKQGTRWSRGLYHNTASVELIVLARIGRE